jgi:predicted nuclease of predicted toxin-antitoxin system
VSPKRVLLDESVPRHLAGPLEAAGFAATPYPNAWKEMTNGELLATAEEQGFDILITNDRNIFSQQNLRGRKLAIVVLPTNLRRLIMDRAADLVDTVNRVEPGQYVVIELSGSRTVVDYNAPKIESSEMPSIQPFKLDN